MANQGITIHLNGAIIRLQNRRIVFKETNGEVLVNFRSAGLKEPDKPSCLHRCFKGKIRDTSILMSVEAMDSLLLAYLEYKKGVVPYPKIEGSNPLDKVSSNNESRRNPLTVSEISV